MTDERNLLGGATVVLADRMWKGKVPRLPRSNLSRRVPQAKHSLVKRLQGTAKNDLQSFPVSWAQRDLPPGWCKPACSCCWHGLTTSVIPLLFLVVLIFFHIIIFGKLTPVLPSPAQLVFRLAVRFCTVGRRGDLPGPEPGQPFAGLMQISSAPLRDALHAARSLSHSHDRDCRPERAPTVIVVVATCCRGFSN